MPQRLKEMSLGSIDVCDITSEQQPIHRDFCEGENVSSMAAAESDMSSSAEDSCVGDEAEELLTLQS